MSKGLIYFCTAVMGDARWAETASHLINWLQTQGYEIYTKHLAEKTLAAQRDALATKIGLSSSSLTPAKIRDHDLTGLLHPDLLCVIAECSGPSLGVGIELATAQVRHLLKDLNLQPVPILAIVNNFSNLYLSTLIVGASKASIHPFAPIQVAGYNNTTYAEKVIAQFLASTSTSR